MATLAPGWALNAQAIDAAGDPHLAPGVHLRLIPSQQLGLPIAPFLVYRLNLGVLGKEGQIRSDITWVDSRGNTLIEPFNVTPDNPVTGYLPPPSSGVCCWINVNAFSGGVTNVKTGLTVEAFVYSPLGPAMVARSTRPVYQLGASRINQIVVSGQGRVLDVQWLDARQLGRSLREPWRILSLPIPGGARYLGTPNAPLEANDRIVRGAPLRLGLHDVPTAATPAIAPPATPAAEQNRLNPLIADTLPLLDRLLNDMSNPPWLLEQVTPINTGTAASSEARINCLGSILSASLDPGMGRWLGLMDVDELPLSTVPTSVVAYIIRGFWHYDPKRLGKILTAQVPKDALLDSLDKLDPATLKLLSTFKGEPVKGQVLDFYTVACAAIANPPARPEPPVMLAPRNGPWLPAVPPAAIREIVLPMQGMPPGAVVALARRQSTIIGLNPKGKSGRALPLVPALLRDSKTTGIGEFSDRKAPAPAVSYRAAQADWFGRWSEWSERNADAGIRPRPPIPTVNAFYVQPTVSTPIPNGLLSGTIRVRVPVPRPDSLAPGSNLLTTLRVFVDGALTSVPLSGSPAELEAAIAGPAIERTGKRSVTITARWVDSAGQVSEASQPVQLELCDPRPPEPLVLPNTLQYASRPDVTGKSRVQLQWTASATQKRFRVFYSDETRLLAAMDKMVAANGAKKAQAQAILATLSTITNPPDRAAVFVANANFFERDLFEQLTKEPIESASPGSTLRFMHQVSGSLRILSFYRVVAVSQSNVEASFASATLVPIGVPNTGPPPQPIATVKPLTDVAGNLVVPYRAQLSVKVARGLVSAVEYRLRRSSTTAGDVLSMPIAKTGSVAPPVADTEQTFVIEDLGTSELSAVSTLKAWTTYSWRLEVRGGAEPGGGPSGEWSTPSAPVTLTLMPPNPPSPATNLQVTALTGGAIQVRWQHPDPLLGGTLGSYYLDVYRQKPNEREERIQSLSADTPAAAGGRNPDRTGNFTVQDAGPIPTGTRYRVVVIDPLGRTSLPVAITT